MRWGLVLWILALVACTDAPEAPLVDGVFTVDAWAVVRGLSRPAELPADPTNRYADDEAAATFGQRLFFEKRLSGPLLVSSELGNAGDVARVSCASCHDPAAWFRDPHAEASLSYGTAVTRRNTPSLVDASQSTWFGWGGAHDVEWKLAASVLENPTVLNSDRLQLAHLIYVAYRDDYNSLFPIPLDPALDPLAPDAARFPASGKPKRPGAPDGAWELMAPDDRTIVNTIVAGCSKALAAYDRRLGAGVSPLDRYAGGELDALPVAAKRGLALFVGKAACTECHAGPMLTDGEFHVTAVPQASDPQDLGRYEDIPKLLGSEFTGAGTYSDDPVAGTAKLVGISATDAMRGRFRTPPLRHLGHTAPYMHDGSLTTLDDVVRFYNEGGAATGFPGIRDAVMSPLGLTDGERADLVAFLGQLDGDPVSEALTTDTAAR